MSQIFKKIQFFLSDLFFISLTFIIWTRLRTSMGLISESGFIPTAQLCLIVCVFWFLLLGFFGHYRTWFTRSRTDEFISIAKTISIGIFIIFILTVDVAYDIEHPVTKSRTLILTYWLLMVFMVSFGRIFIMTIRKRLLEKGIGGHLTLIIGIGDRAKELYRRVTEAPAQGYIVVGFISPGKSVDGEFEGLPVLGEVDGLNRIIKKYGIKEVLIGLCGHSEEMLEKIIDLCEGTDTGIKIIPDLYNVIVGQVKTNQLYGFPLIEILPRLMQPWEWKVKRFMDVVFSLIILIALLPVWIITAIIIKLDSKGPFFYNQKRVGMNGKKYTMLKFRSMVEDAEKISGPVWASWDDPRVTKWGHFMRRVRLDEIPQLINVIKGDMSWVGPRPERPHFVEMFKKEIPLYARRLRIRPGITGWAQIKGVYDQNIEHVKQKLKFDLFYLENMSLRMDLKIIFSTIYIMFQFKGH